MEEHAEKTSSDGFVRSPLLNNSSCDDLLRVRAGPAVESHSIGDWGRNFLPDDVQLHARPRLSYPVGRRFGWITHAAAHQLWQHQCCCSELQYRTDQHRHNSWSLDLSAQITLLCSFYVPRARWISHSSDLERFHEVKNRRTKRFRSTPCVAQFSDICVFWSILGGEVRQFSHKGIIQELIRYKKEILVSASSIVVRFFLQIPGKSKLLVILSSFAKLSVQCTGSRHGYFRRDFTKKRNFKWKNWNKKRFLRFQASEVSGGKNGKPPDSYIWFSLCITMNMKGWLKICTLFLAYI